MENLIHGADSEAGAFLKEWNDAKEYVVARTSGSTGTPKEIRLPKQDMIRSARATCRFFNIGAGSRLVSPLSVSYIAGKMMVVRALESGAELWLETPSNRPLARDYGGIDLLAVVPSQVEHLLENPSKLSKVGNLIIGGGALPQTLRQGLRLSGVNAYLTYGMTETCSHVALCPLDDDEQIYRTLPGIKASLDDRGCLVIEAEDFSFKRLVTNALAEVLDQGRFKWIGRYDNVINSGGIKLFPEKIEALIAGLIDRPYYIIGEKDEKWGEKAVLYIESREMLDTQALMLRMKERLDNRMVPKKIAVVKEFSRTESGKVRRLKL